MERTLSTSSLRWAARLPVASAASVAALRLHAGVSGSIINDEFWLRGDAMTAGLEADLSRLAPVARYTVDEQGQLTPVGRSLPTAMLPAGEWLPLAALLVPALPRCMLPAVLPQRVKLSLVRALGEKPATVMTTSLEAFARWAEDAPLVRLNRLRFAATATHAMIWGNPLPPLQGERFYESAGIALPLGFANAPAVDLASLRELLGLQSGDLALFAADASYERIPAEAFTAASRSAVRLTIQGNADDGEGVQ